jgi:putative ATP-dependent endonuclease of OLD family
LELFLSNSNLLPKNVLRGLGMNNLLFMAAELLLLQSQGDTLGLLLVEEPEAHLHPQLQVRFMSMLRERLEHAAGAQVLLTSHSPVLVAGAPVESLVLTKAAATFPLAEGKTKLEATDYGFLRRFLDATKANLFFAKGVLIVESDAENLLLPAIACRIGRSLSAHGVSIVKVGHTGLFRYSRIFQREDGSVLPIPVACVADRDVPPDAAATFEPRPRKTQKDWSPEQLLARLSHLRRPEGGCVKVFVSPQWTLEFDLAANGLSVELHQAVRLASRSGDRDTHMKAARSEVEEWRSAGKSEQEIALQVFEPLYLGKASKAETAEQLALIIDKNVEDDAATFKGRLPTYLVEAIEHVTGVQAPHAATDPAS